MSKPVQAVVLGGTGYVGGELLRLLTAHPHFELAAAVSESKAGEPIAETFGHLAHNYGDVTFVSHDAWADTLDAGGKLALFAAGPHGASAGMIAAAIDKAASKDIEVHCVDASADFRFRTQQDYEAVYGPGHGAPDLLEDFSSGVPELVDGAITPHIGNPGCFATAVQLASFPCSAMDWWTAASSSPALPAAPGRARAPSRARITRSGTATCTRTNHSRTGMPRRSCTMRRSRPEASLCCTSCRTRARLRAEFM